MNQISGRRNHAACAAVIISAICVPTLVAITQACAATLVAPEEAATPTISPTGAELARLRQLVRTDPDARKLYEKFQATANEARTATPDPIALIQTEGKLQQDPVKIATQQSLRDMGKIAALGWVYTLGASQAATDTNAAKAKEFILAWAAANHSKGDPIDDTNLEPLLVAYDQTRVAFSVDEQTKMETYLRQVAAAETRTGIGPRETNRNNWNSHRLKIIGLIAFLLRDRDMIAETVKGYQRQIEVNLKPDGSSIDFDLRDALHYHLYDLEPLLTLASAARQNGVDLYGYKSPSGASLGKSVQWLIPYCDGTMTHPEFVNSKVSFDRKRAESGDPHYKAGRLFEPKEALATLALAAAFDPQCGVLERKIAGRDGSRFVSWRDVLDAAGRM